MTSIQKFRNELKSGEIALIISSVNRRYLTSFLSSDGFLLVTSDIAELYLDSRYFEMAEKAKANGIIPESIELKKTGVYARTGRCWTENGAFSSTRLRYVSLMKLFSGYTPVAP